MKLSNEEKLLVDDYQYITKDKDYLKLKEIPRHGNTTTYDHSVRVAYVASKIANFLHADMDSTIRVGLLHDFCLVDYHKHEPIPQLYIFYHPNDAIKNSEKFELTEYEEKAILSHMFPIGRFPTNRIGWAITISDKIVAVYEKLYGIKKAKEKSVQLAFRIASIIS